MKTLVIRSSPLTSIGFVANQTTEYFKIEKVDLLTRKENIDNMLKISKISHIIEYNAFSFENIYVDELKVYEYENVIIPINGNLFSYINVIKFCEKNFSKSKIFYCDYNKNFINRISLLKINNIKFILNFISLCLLPIVFAFLIISQIYLIPKILLKNY